MRDGPSPHLARHDATRHTEDVTEDELTERIGQWLDGDVDVVIAGPDNGAPEAAWGDRFFFVADEPEEDRRFGFATIVTRDHPGYDSDSQLDRPGVYRLNIDLDGATFAELFPDPAATHDVAAFDVVVPHPTYAAQHWVSVVNPGPASEDLVRSLVVGAHRRAAERSSRRRVRRGGALSS